MSQAPEVDSGAVGLVKPSAPNEMNLVWIDMEMTGLNPDTDRVIELAAIVTDAALNVLAEMEKPDEIIMPVEKLQPGFVLTRNLLSKENVLLLAKG